ncbi:MAG: DUF6884 domain-containing protein [Promethearchaeota archaeon]
MKQPKVLLVVSCSKKKSPQLYDRKMRAIEAYTGPMFQVIHKAQREGKWDSNLFLGIISAKYGFLRSDEFIENYDLKMTRQIAEKHNPQVIREMIRWNNEEKFNWIYVLMGKTYLKAVEGLEAHINTNIEVENMGGLGIGQQKLVQFLELVSERSMSLTELVK